MRVMYLNPTGQLGGAETSMLAILASMRRAEPSWPLHVVMAAEVRLRSASALGYDERGAVSGGAREARRACAASASGGYGGWRRSSVSRHLGRVVRRRLRRAIRLLVLI